MKKHSDDANILAKVGVVASALAVVPALVILSQFTDDTPARTQAKAERVAAQEAQYRQIMYEELHHRLGNR